MPLTLVYAELKPFSAHELLNWWNLQLPGLNIEFVTTLFLFYTLACESGSMWYLSSLTRNQAPTSCIRKQSLHLWATRGVPQILIYKSKGKYISQHPDIRLQSFCFCLHFWPLHLYEREYFNKKYLISFYFIEDIKY